jgi:nitrate reductase beta subunit
VDLPGSVGASAADLADLCRLLAIAMYDERYVIPLAHAEDPRPPDEPARAAVLPAGHRRRPLHGRHRPPGTGPHGIGSYLPAHQQAGPPGAGQTFCTDDGQTWFDLLGWDGRSSAPGLFPEGGESS